MPRTDNVDSLPIILFDGICNLCNQSIQAVIKRDSKKMFIFASLQSEAGAKLLSQYGAMDSNIDSVVLVHAGEIYIKSDAVLEIIRILGGPYTLILGFQIIPRFIRDFIYDWIARNRYGWFGKREACMIPTPDLRDRFLD